MFSQSQTNNPTINGQVSITSSKYQSNVASDSDLIDDPEKQKKIKRLKSVSSLYTRNK